MSGLVTAATEGRVPVAHVHGEIDLSNARRMRDAVIEIVTDDAAGLIVDLADVPYLDSAAIQALFEVARRLRDSDQALVVTVPSGSPLRRLLKVTRFHEAATICDSIVAAAEHLGSINR